MEACHAAKNEGVEVLGVAAIFTYELQSGKDNFKENNMPLITLTNYSTLINTALAENYIEENELQSLQAWKKKTLIIGRKWNRIFFIL